jgi:hypothetical protein
MAGPNEAPDPRMNANDLYREDTYSDRKVGSIRVMTPVKSDGSVDPGRKVVYVGQAQIMTPAGVLPLSFEIDAKDLNEACAMFADGARQGLEDTMRELQEMRRESASSIVIPEAGAASALGKGMQPPGKIKIP